MQSFFRQLATTVSLVALMVLVVVVEVTVCVALDVGCAAVDEVPVEVLAFVLLKLVLIGG